jgi:hypothetical protein
VDLQNAVVHGDTDQEMTEKIREEINAKVSLLYNYYNDTHILI